MNLRTHVIAGMLTLASVALGALAAEPSEADREAMQGTWTIQAFTVDGKDIPANTLATWRRIVAGKHVIWKQGEEILVEMDMEFDPTQKPMTLDSTVASGDSKGQKVLAIYEWTDDLLRVCFALPDKPRPTEFSSVLDSGRWLFTAKRVQP